MLNIVNILFFFYFSYLAGKLFSKRAYSKDCVYLAALIGYIGLMDLANTNGTLYSNGATLIVFAFIIKAALIYCSYHTLNKCKKIEVRMKKDAERFNKSPIAFDNSNSKYRYSKAG